MCVCSDKIPRNDRVYVQAKEVQALQEGKGPPVSEALIPIDCFRISTVPGTPWETPAATCPLRLTMHLLRPYCMMHNALCGGVQP